MTTARAESSPDIVMNASSPVYPAPDTFAIIDDVVILEQFFTLA